MDEKNNEKYRTVEKSKLSASFFCINAVPKPFVKKTFAIVMNTVTSEIMPYSEGAIKRARMTVTTKDTNWAANLSENFQNTPLRTAFFSLFMFSDACLPQKV